jgi:hypothetical protein
VQLVIMREDRSVMLHRREVTPACAKKCEQLYNLPARNVQFATNMKNIVTNTMETRTVRNRGLLERLAVGHLSEKLSVFMTDRHRIHNSLCLVPIPRQQKLTHALTLHFFKIHINSVLQSTSRPSKWLIL